MSGKTTVKEVLENTIVNVTKLIEMILEYIPSEKATILEIRRRAVELKREAKKSNDDRSNLIFQIIIDKALDEHSIVKKAKDDVFGSQMR